MEFMSLPKNSINLELGEDKALPDEAEDLIIHGKDYLSFAGNLLVSVIVQHLQKALNQNVAPFFPKYYKTRSHVTAVKVT
jgi:hypothetical protein